MQLCSNHASARETDKPSVFPPRFRKSPQNDQNCVVKDPQPGYDQSCGTHRKLAETRLVEILEIEHFDEVFFTQSNLPHNQVHRIANTLPYNQLHRTANTRSIDLHYYRPHDRNTFLARLNGAFRGLFTKCGTIDNQK